ncbi:MAG: phosphate signaling complex protein PhoU [Chloroflexi bacterium]|nr:phosphate signaling complex protein PhoU [Chloroflexota bacterium]
MYPRARFDRQLQHVRQDLLQMASLVDRAIERGVDALLNSDLELARQVVSDDDVINAARVGTEKACLGLLATQQPAACDLRTLIAANNMAMDLERMGDYAKGVARITLRMPPGFVVRDVLDTPRMALQARDMLKRVMEAFVDGDAERARALCSEDDRIDALYQGNLRILLSHMAEEPAAVTPLMYLVWAAHNIERIGDRVTNVAEQIIFMCTGEFEDMNPHAKLKDQPLA